MEIHVILSSCSLKQQIRGNVNFCPEGCLHKSRQKVSHPNICCRNHFQANIKQVLCMSLSHHQYQLTVTVSTSSSSLCVPSVFNSVSFPVLLPPSLSDFAIPVSLENRSCVHGKYWMMSLCMFYVRDKSRLRCEYRDSKCLYMIKEIHFICSTFTNDPILHNKNRITDK